MNAGRKVASSLALWALCLGVVDPAWGQPTEHKVQIISDMDAFHMYFEPRHLRIETGDTVTWINQEAMIHNVMTYPDGFPQGAAAFESPFLAKADETYSQTFELPGVYEYHCLPHLIMGMHGSIQVGDPSTEAEFHVPSAAEVKVYRNKLLEYFDQDDISTFQGASAVVE